VGAPIASTADTVSPASPSGTVTIQATTDTTTEGSSTPGVFTVTASVAPAGPLYVSFTFDAKSTAIGGTDFTISPGAIVLIAAGTTTATITVYPWDDNSSGERKWNEDVVLDLTSATGSGSGGGTYTIGSPSQATVSIRDNDLGEDHGCLCDPPLFPGNPAADGGDPAALGGAASGVAYGTGVATGNNDGLTSTGFGKMIGQSLTWSNISGFSDSYLTNGSPNGVGMVNSGLPSLQQFLPGGNIVAVSSGTAALWFDYQQSGAYTAEFYEGTEYALQADGSTGDFLLTDAQGDSVRFYGFGTSLPLAQRGQFKSFTDPYGDTISVTSHSGSGQTTEVQRSVVSAGVTTTESFLYSYITTGDLAGLVQNVTLRRQVGAGGWTTIRQAAYTYYDGQSSEGRYGDLETEQIEDAVGNVLDTTYFRYYLPGEANGYTDGLKYYFGPAAYARLAAAVGNPLSASDAQVAPYADHYYQYDTSQRVTLVTTQGAGATGPGT
jgi:hypothetical protein